MTKDSDSTQTQGPLSMFESGGTRSWYRYEQRKLAVLSPLWSQKKKKLQEKAPPLHGHWIQPLTSNFLEIP